MAEWVVSLHASTNAQVKSLGNMGTVAKVHPMISIPKGIRMYFYTKEKTPLDSSAAWPLFYQLMGNSAQQSLARSRAVEVRRSPEAVFDYSMVGDNSWNDAHGTASGIFEAGNRFGQQNWGFNAHDKRSLSWLFKYCAPGDAIHWLCCRVWN